ncbi:major capsid protein [Bifidobacterium sp.]|uniref:major capsid protein n=1 Tax=Bifidobacterium sp. TaxID=41200 RepID=UPI0039E9460C
MSLTLAEAAKLSQSSLKRGVLETFVQESPILDRIPFLSIEGNAYSYNEELTLPGVAFRAVNGSYPESTGTVNQKSETLVILGGDADVDRFIQKTRSNLNDQRATQTAMKVKAMSYKFQDTFFNGDTGSDPNGFDGLKKRLTGNQVLSAPNVLTGIPILGNGGTDVHAFLDALDRLLASVPGITPANGAIYMNGDLMGKYRSALRHVGYDTTLQQDVHGKRVLQWNGISVLDAGLNPDGTKILPNTEEIGVSTTKLTDTASVYAVRFGNDEGDQAVTGLTNGGVDVQDLGQLQEKPSYRTRIEFYTGLAVFGGKAAARLTGVRNA